MGVQANRLKRAIQSGKLLGADRTCEDYPCHFNGQDCTWCFCPFYPCEDESTGGKLTKTRKGEIVWGCADCDWIHRPEVAQRVLKELLKGPREPSRERLIKTRSKILREVPPRS